jgi:hypothetical protein
MQDGPLTKVIHIVEVGVHVLPAAAVNGEARTGSEALDIAGTLE